MKQVHPHPFLHDTIRGLDLSLYRYIDTALDENPLFFQGYWRGSLILVEGEISMVYHDMKSPALNL